MSYNVEEGAQEPQWPIPLEETAMIDELTRNPLHVSTEGDAGPYIMLPFDRLGDVRQLLDSQRIPYSVEEEVISLDESAEIAVVNLGRDADVAAVQSILDNAA